jgi:hypothetical protein
MNFMVTEKHKNKHKYHSQRILNDQWASSLHEPVFVNNKIIGHALLIRETTHEPDQSKRNLCLFVRNPYPSILYIERILS